MTVLSVAEARASRRMVKAESGLEAIMDAASSPARSACAKRSPGVMTGEPQETTIRNRAGSARKDMDRIIADKNNKSF